MVNDSGKQTDWFSFAVRICGNALTLMCVDDNQQDTESPIVFAEWTLVSGSSVKRRDFRLDVLLRENDNKDNYSMNFFFVR